MKTAVAAIVDGEARVATGTWDSFTLEVAMPVHQLGWKLCVVYVTKLSTGSSDTATFKKTLDAGKAGAVDMTYLSKADVAGNTFVFNPLVDVTQGGDMDEATIIARLGKVAAACVAMANKGFAVEGMRQQAGSPNDIRVKTSKDGVEYTVRFAFKESTTEAHVLYYKWNQDLQPGRLMLVSSLTEGDGTGVWFDGEIYEWSSINTPHLNYGTTAKDSVHTVEFNVDGVMKELSFPDWLRNHDVTADNFKALSVERQAELLLAFFNAETFTGVALGVGLINLNWHPSGNGNYQVPYVYTSEQWQANWHQQQVASKPEWTTLSK